MIRSFIALPLPFAVAADLERLRAPIPDARWVAQENLHITLAFLGDQTPHALEDADLALSDLRAPELSLRLDGLGVFGGDKPHALYAALVENPDLRRLEAKVERALRAAGLKFEGRAYTPHVTLAWLGRRAPKPRILNWLEGFGYYRGPEFRADSFGLYRSDLGAGGPIYEAMREYPLGDGQNRDAEPMDSAQNEAAEGES